MSVRPIRKKYSHAIADAKKAQKRQESEARQEARSKLTDEQQLARLDKNGHSAKKERARLSGA